MADLRQILVRGGLAAAVTTGAGLMAASPDPPAEQVSLRARAAVPQPGASVRLVLPERSHLAPPSRDLFGTPPVPPAPRVEHVPVPPPLPEAPPLPFTLVGSFETEGGETAYYLAEADKVYVVKRGEALNELYRLESAAADRLELLYLPMAIKQTLVFSNPK